MSRKVRAVLQLGPAEELVAYADGRIVFERAGSPARPDEEIDRGDVLRFFALLLTKDDLTRARALALEAGSRVEVGHLVALGRLIGGLIKR